MKLFVGLDVSLEKTAICVVSEHGPYSLEFDAAGTFELTFVPLRPGRYDFYVDGYQKQGMIGAFVVN